MIKLSILIPTLPERVQHLNVLLENLNRQRTFEIEIIVDKRGREVTTGEKRNDLVTKSRGLYTVFVDDDDEIPPYYVEKVIEKINNEAPDVICLDGFMTTDGFNPTYWEIRLGNPYKAVQRDGKEFYLRFPNHICPMKRVHSIKVKFPHKTVFEDFEWANEINMQGLLKTQSIISTWMYHYKLVTNK